MTFTVGSLFSGIGGIDLAFQEAGFQIAYQVENNGYCQQVLEKHWPTVRRYGNIFDIDTLPAVDVMAGGFPCQPVSVAGQRRGEQDERWLWPEFLRLIQQSRPTVVFLENVPGLRTIDGGNTFRDILRQLAKSGYDAQWAHLRASDAGAPHKRERIFIVAYTGSFRRPESETLANAAPDKEWHISAYQSKWKSKFYATVAKCETLGHAPEFRCNRDQPFTRSATTGKSQRRVCQSARTDQIVGNTRCARLAQRQSINGHIGQKFASTQRAGYSYRQGRGTQSRLGRDSSRIPYRLDGHRFPAPPGEPYEWEPPRTTQVKTNRAARIQALGNAVVPQVVYPIALAIREWMEAHNER